MTTALDQLKQYTTVVADTGDFQQLAQYKPRDATTNPSLILKAVQKDDYKPLLEKTVKAHASKPVGAIIDQLLIAFGTEILKIIPGRVSTEVDARLSFDTEALDRQGPRTDLAVRRARHRPRTRADQAGFHVGRHSRGRSAAEGRHPLQHDAAVLARPGRRLRRSGRAADLAVRRPDLRLVQEERRQRRGTKRKTAAPTIRACRSVRSIYAYYKKFGYKTEVMGASFRTPGQILELAGCDLLTISPDLLQKLQDSTDKVERKLSPDIAKDADIERVPVDEVVVPLPRQRRSHGD